MKTAIIGLGNIGSTVAANLAAGGSKVLLVDKGNGRAEALASELGDAASASDMETALDTADVIVLAIYFEAIKAFLAEHAGKLAGKIIVDPSNPIAPDGNGGFKKIIPQDQSSGTILAGLLPQGAKLVKAFGTLGAGSLKSGANRRPERAVLFYASDDAGAGKTVAELISASGFDPVSVGGIGNAIKIEVFGDLHEFGKLGRLVSAKEAKDLL